MKEKILIVTWVIDMLHFCCLLIYGYKKFCYYFRVLFLFNLRFFPEFLDDRINEKSIQAVIIANETSLHLTFGCK